jgi:hypothetical protein
MNQKRKLPCYDHQLCQFVIETMHQVNRFYGNVQQSKECYMRVNTPAQTALSLLHPIPDGGSTESTTTPEEECHPYRYTLAPLLRDAMQRARIAVMVQPSHLILLLRLLRRMGMQQIIIVIVIIIRIICKPLGYYVNVFVPY